jgi:hypothetical protein
LILIIALFPGSYITAWAKLFPSTWKDFQIGFKQILKSLGRSRELLEESTNLIQIEEWQKARLQVEGSPASIERERKHRETLKVLNWLSAPDVNLDQEQGSARREEFPYLGRWILKEPGISAVSITLPHASLFSG